jgi:hypothetical protein
MTVEEKARAVVDMWHANGQSVALATLIAAAIAGAVSEEREECAKLCDAEAHREPGLVRVSAHNLAIAIRARK